MEQAPPSPAPLMDMARGVRAAAGRAEGLADADAAALLRVSLGLLRTAKVEAIRTVCTMQQEEAAAWLHDFISHIFDPLEQLLRGRGDLLEVQARSKPWPCRRPAHSHSLRRRGLARSSPPHATFWRPCRMRRRCAPVQLAAPSLAR